LTQYSISVAFCSHRFLVLLDLDQDGLELGHVRGVLVGIGGPFALAVAAAEADKHAVVGGVQLRLGGLVGLDGTARVDGFAGLRRQGRDQHQNDECR